jgi:hypothetical protein
MLWLVKDCTLVRCQALWKLRSLPLMWIPQNGIHNRLEFLGNPTGSWKSLRDYHSSHSAYYGAFSSLAVFWGATTRYSGYPLKTRKRPFLGLFAARLSLFTIRGTRRRFRRRRGSGGRLQNRPARLALPSRKWSLDMDGPFASLNFLQPGCRKMTNWRKLDLSGKLAGPRGGGGTHPGSRL